MINNNCNLFISNQTIELIEEKINCSISFEKTAWAWNHHHFGFDGNSKLRVDMYKRNQNRIEKIIKLYENIKNQSVLLETNDFNEEQIMEFLKKFCSLKHQQFLFQSRIDVFDNDCYPVIKNILEENISKKNTLVLKIAEFFKPKLTGFPNFFQECLLNFDEECYSIVKEINKDLQN